MVDSELFDVIVIGGGPVGLAAAYEVTKAGRKVIILEQNNFFNHAGSSGGLARIFRTMYTEEFMTKFAKTSMKYWDDLENDAGFSLRLMSGLLNFGEEGAVMSPTENLDKLGMDYKKLTAAEIEQKYSFKNLNPEWVGLFAPDNGIINVQLLVRTLHSLAKDRGTQAKQHTQIHVVTYGLSATYFTKKIIIASGNCTNAILRPNFGISLDLEARKIVKTYFNADLNPNGTVFPSPWFHSILMENKRPRVFYGMPALPWGPPDIVQVAVDTTTRDIEDLSTGQGRVSSPAETEDTQKFIRDHIIGVDHTIPTSTITCVKRNVSDDIFVLDFLPEQYLHGGPEKSIALFTAGWAMKFVPLLGKALSQMICNGESEFAYKEFSITRKNPMTGKDIIVKEDKEDVVVKNSMAKY
ncbi:hypothetical protein B0T10DRAFT_541211 [Thelonectria olida]|uniref:FAD dependent oxidoreductase domain-containing protein n=1 Tax=Thelonectria olida TaxID=1576542 RepID=A0A9P8VSU8_9HYPO|nr:hypothetical protein B0T10DRAFT_541211 [Thelonectria olida]